MSDSDDGDIRRYLDISVEVTAESTVRVRVWEQDSSSNQNKDEVIGDITITRDDLIEGSKVASDDGQSRVFWRVLAKPIPTVRIHGIMCQKSSSGCNPAVIEKICEAASEASEKASKAIGKVKTPRAQAISTGFKAASHVIEGIALFSEWIADALEGDDDVYSCSISIQSIRTPIAARSVPRPEAASALR